MADQDYIANDEALARYLQYGSDDESNKNSAPNFVTKHEAEEEDPSGSESEEYEESEGENGEGDSVDEEEEYDANYDQRERPTNATVTRKATNTRFEPTQVAPQGLHSAQINDAALLADSLREANSVFDGECAGQIATNQHFFVNLPFPIGGTREAGTAIFELEDPHIPRLSELIRHTLHKLSFVAGGKKVMHEGMLARANIIVRRYSKGQHISFHIDERECASAVFGFILQNDHPQHKGLEFRRGEDKKQLSYVMQEYPGTAFILTHEARYKWRHGLLPVSACRVSVTCRFFKTDVFANYRTSLGLPKPLKSWQQRRLKRQEQEQQDQQTQEPQRDEEDSQQTQPAPKNQPTQTHKPQPQKPPQKLPQKPQAHKQEPTLPKPSPQEKPQEKSQEKPKEKSQEKPQEPKKPEDIHIELCLNKDPHQTKPALVSPKADIKQLVAAAKNKLRVKAKKFFAEGGVDVTAGLELHPGDTVYVSLGEDFNAANKSGKKSAPASDSPAQNEDPTAGFGIATVRERMAWWAAYRYAQLRFWIAQDPTGRTACRGAPVADAAELGQLVAASHLSVPELREIVLALRATVEDPQNALTWGFHSAEWEDGRSTSICLIRATDGAWVEFVSEGKPTVKGARKRDGPLWKLEGGLNNPAESGGPVKLLSEVAAEVTQDLQFPAPKNSQKAHMDRGDEDDVARRKRKPKKKKEQNAYQSKRGVEFTDKYVLFAGTVWCSSYYTCSLEVDGITYTSSTQFVMSEQARLFGDEARRQELLDASNAAAPHREFDHKAPKTGVRRVNNFDADVWRTYKERLMWRGTYEKFTQNPTLRHKALEAGTRTFVEATEDPMWGIGICLSHPDAKNEQRWRGPNLMGRMLTALARLLRAEQVAPDAGSPARLGHLRELAQDFELDAGDLEAFGERALNQTGDPDLFPVPGWPGTQAVRDAAEYCKTSKISVEGILEGLAIPTQNQDLLNHRPALLYLVEGVLGLRWL